MMHILFEQSGGFMGRTISLELDLQDLPDADAGTLLQLIDEANFFSLPANMPPTGARDDFHYRVTIQAETSQHTVRTSDASAPPELRPLLQELSKRARSQPR